METGLYTFGELGPGVEPTGTNHARRTRDDLADGLAHDRRRRSAGGTSAMPSASPEASPSPSGQRRPFERV